MKCEQKFKSSRSKAKHFLIFPFVVFDLSLGHFHNVPIETREARNSIKATESY